MKIFRFVNNEEIICVKDFTVDKCQMDSEKTKIFSM